MTGGKWDNSKSPYIKLGLLFLKLTRQMSKLQVRYVCLAHTFTPFLLAELQTKAEAMKRAGAPLRSTPYAKRTKVGPKRASVAKTVRSTIRRMATKNVLITTQNEIVLDSSAPGAITSWTDTTAVIDGVRPSDRTTATISLDKIRCRGQFVGPPNGTYALPIRMVVGYIKNQVAPSPTFKLFESLYGEGAARDFTQVLGMDNQSTPLNSRDFTVLVDRNLVLGSSGADGKNVYSYDFTLPLKGRKVHFEGNTEGPGNQDLNLVIAAWIADPQDDATVLSCEWHGCNSLTYTDKI